MSSDKAPEKLYWSRGIGSGTHKEPFLDDYCVEPITYIREDLTLDAKLKKPGAIVPYKTEEEKELASLMNEINKTEILRRREIFEKYCIAMRAMGASIAMTDWSIVRELVNKICYEADKFARGEE